MFCADKSTKDSSNSTSGAAAAAASNLSSEEDDDEDMEEDDDDDDDDEIPLDMEDLEAVTKKARQDEELKTEHIQVTLYSKAVHCLYLLLTSYTRVDLGLGKV